jgi:hypothetical protein
MYAKLYKKFPTEATVKKYYGSFLDVLFDKRGQLYLNQNDAHLNTNESSSSTASPQYSK